MLKLLGMGIFSWETFERRSNRYGSFCLSANNYECNVTCQNYISLNVAREYIGKKVKLIAKVIASRNSGHIGDLALKIFPTRPNVGDLIEIGVGEFILESIPIGMKDCSISILPNDGRKIFLIDPRKFYMLHDQTVEIYIEKTEEDFSPVYKPGDVAKEMGVYSRF
jgi:hypothetical protein